jgi:glycosyltransferase involved in cell wall biosynthesis
MRKLIMYPSNFNAPATILIVHHSAELYGADLSLLDLLSGLDMSRFTPIVCIPEQGPLVDRLKVLGIEVHITPLLKLSRHTLSTPWKLPLVLSLVFRALREISTLVKGRKIDLVYTNTLAVIAGALWAAKNRVPHVWHVREIIPRPRLASIFFRAIVSALSDQVICNSDETRRWIAPRSSATAVTVWNGTKSIDATLPLGDLRAAARAKFNLAQDVPVVLMVGRVNARKGQDLLLNAVEMIDRTVGVPFHLMFVGGGAPGETRSVKQLLRNIAASTHRCQISVHSFADQINEYYLAADIVVVPSRHPESFGRVVIEAMSYGLPVIAAAHGGVLESVENKRTGLFFQPNNAHELYTQLMLLLKDGELRRRLGLAGRERQRDLFTVETYVEKVQTILLAVIGRAS